MVTLRLLWHYCYSGHYCEVFPIPMLLPSFFTVLMAKPQSFTITVVNTVVTAVLPSSPLLCHCLMSTNNPRYLLHQQSTEVLHWKTYGMVWYTRV